MSKPQIALLATSAAAMLFLLTASPAGTAMPNLMRAVHINGVSGPAYYSVVEGGYRPIRTPTGPSGTANERVAEAVDSAQTN